MNGKIVENLERIEKELEEEKSVLEEALRHISAAIIALEMKEVSDVTGKAALMERLEHPEEPVKVEETAKQPHLEPLPTRTKPTETRPTSQQMGKGRKRYADVSTRTAILDVLDNHREPADAKRIHEDLVKGGWTCTSDNPIASVRAALSAMRFDDISQKKIQVGPRKIAHYYLPTMDEMANRR